MNPIQFLKQQVRAESGARYRARAYACGPRLYVVRLESIAPVESSGLYTAAPPSRRSERV